MIHMYQMLHGGVDVHKIDSYFFESLKSNNITLQSVTLVLKSDPANFNKID